MLQNKTSKNIIQIGQTYRRLKIGGSGFLCAKNLYETKYQFLIKKRESPGSKHFNDSKDFVEYSSNMNNTYKSIEEYRIKKQKYEFCLII